MLFICLIIIIVSYNKEKRQLKIEKQKELVIAKDTAYSGISLYLSKLVNLDEYEAVEIETNELEVVGEEEPIEQEQEEIVLDENEVDLLARAIYNECGILGYDGMYLCGCVILNRVNSNIYPNDLYSVIYQHSGNRYQYDIVRNGMINRNVEDERAYEIARDLLTNGSSIPNDVLFQSQFKQGSYVYRQIGNTYFCGL